MSTLPSAHSASSMRTICCAEPSQNNCPLCFLVPGDAVAFDLGDEILRRVARERGAAKAGIFRDEIFWLRIAIGEIAAAATGDADLLAQRRGVIDDGDALAGLRDLRRAKQARGAGAEDDDIVERRFAHIRVTPNFFKRLTRNSDK